ncbi:MAG: ABC transporter ATP-binding protein, partial [Rhodospirillales bacterium]|nr:ABC transporter ATP-binding protein [Rhodospirillales bacterium]
EPLGALDLKLREAMQEELKTLHRSLGITFVFVTHDQGEALSMADRVAVFNDGKIMQVASPKEIYQHPSSRFVADFVGSSNILSPEFTNSVLGQAAWASLRPEAIRIVAGGSGRISSRCVSKNYQGSTSRIALDAGGQSLTVLLHDGDESIEIGDEVALDWDADKVHIMEDQS